MNNTQSAIGPRFGAKAHLAAWLGATGVLLWAFSAGQAVTFDLDYDRYPYEAPSWDPHGSTLTDHFEAAAALWSDIIKDSHEIRVQYQWEELDDAAASTIWHISEKHYFDTNGNGINDSSVERIVNCTIRVDPTISWWVDPTPWDHSEFNDPISTIYRDHTDTNPAEPAYAGFPPDLLEVSCDMTPISHTGRDLYTTIIHEFGHALGFNMASTDIDPPYPLPSHMVWGADVSIHDERHQGDQNRGHIDVPRALMSYNRVSQNRTLPSASDVLPMATFCHWTQIDLPRKDFMHVDGAEAYWDHRLNWSGARVPDAQDVVYIRSGDDVIVHWDAEAKSVSVSDGSRLTVTGNQVLRLEELNIASGSALKLRWSGSRVEFLDPATGAPLSSPRLTLSGSLEMANQGRQSLGSLTIQHETPGAGTAPHLHMAEDAILSLVNELNLLGGAEADISDSDILITSPARAEVNLNGPMTLRDGATLSTRSLSLTTDDGIAPNLEVLSASRFTVTDDGGFVETLLPGGAAIRIDNTGSEFSLAHDLRSLGTVSIQHGSMHVRNMEVESGAELLIDYGGQLRLVGDAGDGELTLRRGCLAQIQHNGSVIEANDIQLYTSMDVLGAARLQTGVLRLNAWTGDDSSPITLTLAGAGNVLQTDRLNLKSSPSHSAGVVHTSGLATVSQDMEIESAPATSRYQLGGGRLTVNRDLRIRDAATFQFDLNDGTFELAALDIQGTGQFLLNLNGGLFDLDALPASGIGQMTLNLNGGEFFFGTLGPWRLGQVNVATIPDETVNQPAPTRELLMTSLTVGQTGDGSLTLTGPTAVRGPLVVGRQSQARGELIFSPLDSWTLLEAESLQVGPDGYGSVTQTNGYVDVDEDDALTIGRGVYNLQGGRLQTQTTLVGTKSGRNASLHLAGGRHDVDTLRIGLYGLAATCRIDSGRLDAGQIVVGDLRQGSVIQNHGTTDVARNLQVGKADGLYGSVEMNNGFMNIAGHLEIAPGLNGRGNFLCNGGSISVHGNLLVGEGNDSIGRFEGYESLDVDGDISIGAGTNAQADFRIEGSAGSWPTLDVGGGIRIAGGTDSRADFYIVGQGSNGPTLWLTDGIIDIGSGGNGTLHLAGGGIRAVRNLAGKYDSYLKVQPGSSLRGFGRVEIPVINTGLVSNDSNIPLTLMEEISGDGLYQTLAHPANFQEGRIEFWNGGQVTGGILSDGRVSAFSSSSTLRVKGPIRGSGVFEAVGQVETSDLVDIAQLRVTGSLRQVSGRTAPGLLQLEWGTYTMDAGSLETTNPSIGGTFQLNGGQVRIDDRLTIGPEGGFSAAMGTLSLAGGSLHVAGDLQVGADSDPAMPVPGTLRFTTPDPVVTVEGDLVLTSFATLETVEGATIYLSGSNVINTSQNAEALSGLSQLTLDFAADGSVLDTLEVAGDPEDDFEKNFALAGLILRSRTRLQLVDRVDNTGAAALEALLVGSLKILDEATLDLNGLSLLVEDSGPGEIQTWIDEGVLFNSATTRIDLSWDSARNCTLVASAPVPEPACLLLLALGAMKIAACRKDRLA